MNDPALFEKDISFYIDQERKIDQTNEFIKDVIYMCPNCLQYSFDYGDIFGECMFCFHTNNINKEFFSEVYDSLYYGWIYRIILEKQLRQTPQNVLHPSLPNTDLKLLIFANYLLLKETGKTGTIVSMDNLLGNLHIDLSENDDEFYSNEDKFRQYVSEEFFRHKNIKRGN